MKVKGGIVEQEKLKLGEGGQDSGGNRGKGQE